MIDKSHSVDIAPSAVSFNCPDVFVTRNDESEPGSKEHNSGKFGQRKGIEVIAFKSYAAEMAGCDKTSQVSMCCHETSKQLALLEQRLQFKDEQTLAERTQARLREAQYV